MRVFDLLFNQFAANKIDDCLCYKPNNEWVKFSTSKVIGITNRISLALLDMGIQKGDRVGIVSENRPEWNFIDFACQQIGAILVPMYPTIGPKDYQFIIEQSEVKVIFVSDKQILAKVREALSDGKSIPIFTFNGVKGFPNWRELIQRAKDQDPANLKMHRDEVFPQDILTIIYTSGTTGNPKGVMLSHDNIVSNVIALEKGATVHAGDRALSFLPLNHIFERTIAYAYINNSVGIYYAQSLETIGDNLKEIKPHIFNTVPRLLEKVYDNILKRGSELSGLKRGIFNWAISLALRYDPNQSMGAFYNKQLEIARKLVFSKWREALGGNIRQINSGGAALQERLARVFWAADIKILEGYGLTETSPIVTYSTLDNYRIGCVGKLAEGVDLKIEEDGELLVKGPNVMMGYYKNEDLTNEVLRDGWFRTGDIGQMEEGFLRITDRKKELFKTSGGLYITPQKMENRLKESILIDQAMIIGDGRKFPAAILVPNFEELVEEMSKKFIMASHFEEMVLNPEVLKIFEREIERVNKDLGQWEKIKQFRVVTDQWSLESGELTPTLKLKRRIIQEKYRSLIEDIYQDDGTHIFDEVEGVTTEELEKAVAEEINNA